MYYYVVMVLGADHSFADSISTDEKRKSIRIGSIRISLIEHIVVWKWDEMSSSAPLGGSTENVEVLEQNQQQ